MHIICTKIYNKRIGLESLHNMFVFYMFLLLKRKFIVKKEIK